MRPFHLTGFLVLAAWQLAPVQVAPDSTGRLRLSVAAGAGRYEDATFDCNGNFVSAVPVEVRSAGARLDAMVDPSTRLTMYGGVHDADEGWGDGSGGFGGVQIAHEGRRIGIGAGAVKRGTPSGVFGPNFYLRLGDAERTHFRLEALPPTETFYLTNVARIGMGFGQGNLRRTGGYVGVGWGPYAEQLSQGTAFADLDIPAAGNIDLLLRAQAGPGYEVFQWGLAAGMRYHFPR
ncbi:MAG: hypothetical protein Q8Q85_05555 [Gemmatimonadales bacterium]|nr:hypothetical protein [Gemmatimonadales bacterium]